MPVKFVDVCEVDVLAGTGGNGAVAFRREKFMPFGGPSGGDGGRGGDVVFRTDPGMSTLLDVTHTRMLRAEHGEQGHGKDMYGRGGKDLVVRVPVGTQVYDRETGELLFDLDQPNQDVVVAKGGKGGRGNIHFSTPYDRAPRRSEPGEPGQERKLRLELKVIADVGLLGFPNVGKSTFIRACSRAQPKVADYPFTTLTPHLGVVRIGDEASFVMADIPGLIPGAAEGAGLGYRFLRHVERTRALLHLVTLDPAEGRDPVADYDALRGELGKFDEELVKRPEIVAMTKADLPEVREAFEDVKRRFEERGVDVRLVSAVTHENVRPLLVDLYRLVTGQAEIEDWERPLPKKAAAPPAATAKDQNGVHAPAAMAGPEEPEAPRKTATKKAAAKKKKAAAPAKTKAAPAKKKAAPAKKAVPAKKVATPATKKKAAATKKAAAAKKTKVAPATKKKAAAAKKTKVAPATKKKAAPAKKKAQRRR